MHQGLEEMATKAVQAAQERAEEGGRPQKRRYVPPPQQPPVFKSYEKVVVDYFEGVKAREAKEKEERYLGSAKPKFAPVVVGEDGRRVRKETRGGLLRLAEAVAW